MPATPLYGSFHKGFSKRPLHDLTKETVMEHFDELVTYPTVQLADVEAHLATLSGGDEYRSRRGARHAVLNDPISAARKDRIAKS